MIIQVHKFQVVKIRIGGRHSNRPFWDALAMKIQLKWEI